MLGRISAVVGFSVSGSRGGGGIFVNFGSDFGGSGIFSDGLGGGGGIFVDVFGVSLRIFYNNSQFSMFTEYFVENGSAIKENGSAK